MVGNKAVSMLEESHARGDLDGFWSGKPESSKESSGATLSVSLQPENAMTFHEERLTGIGGSDAASLFNIGYGCRRRLWYDKRGVQPDFERETTDAMELGTFLEPYIIRKYTERTGRDTSSTQEMQRHQLNKRLLVHVDGFVYDNRRPYDNQRGVLECKAVSRRVFYTMRNEGVTEDYVLQLHHGIYVCGLTWGSFAIMNRESGELIWFDVEADKEIGAAIDAAGAEFWILSVVGGAEPDRLDPEDKRCNRCSWRRTCQGQALSRIDNDKPMVEDESLRPLLMEYLEHKGVAETADDLLTEAKEALGAAIGDRPAVKVAGHPIYYKKQSRKLSLFDQLAKAYCEATGKSPAEVEAAFTTKGKEFRSLRVY